MDGSEAVLKRTAKAAIRLLKSKIRQHIYTTKNKGAAADETRWSAMLLVEEGFIGPARREWQEVLEAWGDPIPEADRKVLRKVIADAFAPAATDVLSIFDDDQHWPMRKIIADYHRAFNPDDLLK